ncbi:TRAP transporter small permease [Salipiger sp.]|uniref:TRAP transporter small permease n=1 Tax=Salipiger sp. TaxID=2078585 RepID=UPI003A980FF9
MDFITKAIDVLTKALAALAGTAVLALMVHVSADVAMRAFFNTPLTGTIIFVSNYYMILAVCLPLALVERNDAQISVDVVTELLPSGPKRHLYGWTLPISAAVFGIVAFASWNEAVTQWRINKFVIEGGVRFVIWYGYFAVPFGYGMATLWMVLKFIRYLSGRSLLIAETSDEITQVPNE